MTLALPPQTDPVALQIAVIAGTLQDAVMQDDFVQTLISTADLDRMVRALAPHQQAAATQARSAIARALAVLEASRATTAPRDLHIRAAYRVAGAA